MNPNVIDLNMPKTLFHHYQCNHIKMEQFFLMWQKSLKNFVNPSQIWKFFLFYRSNEIPIFHRSCTHWHPNPKRNMENVSIFRERTSSAYRPWNRISWSPRNLFPVRYVSLEGRGQTRPWTVLAMVGQIMCGSRRPYFYVNHLLWPSIVAKAHDLAF